MVLIDIPHNNASRDKYGTATSGPIIIADIALARND
jgi:hypothetical protein